MIREIILRETLPSVFSGMEQEEPLRHSQVWMRNLSFHRPGFYLVESESGAGKSSLCSFIYGNRGDYSGHILFDGRDISGFGVDEWCRLRMRSLAYLPQEMRLFPELTVMENIRIKNRLTECKSEEWILKTLHRLEIADKANVEARYLSVGQQQRAAMVRALCQPFDFLLVDEPVSHLDARNNSVAAEIISEEAQANDAAVIATSVGNKIMLPFTSVLQL